MAYLYRHIRLDKNEVFYIGIGSDNNGNHTRAFCKSKTKRSEFWINITKKTDYKVEIILDDLSWSDACLKEIEFISLYGRKDLNLGTLVNLTNGGESSFCFGEQTLNKIREARSRQVFSEDSKIKRANTLRKLWNSPEYEHKREMQRMSAIKYYKLGIISRAGYPSKKKGKPFAGDRKMLSESLLKHFESNDVKDSVALSHGAKWFNVFIAINITKGKYNVPVSAEKGDFIGRFCNVTRCARDFNTTNKRILMCLRNELVLTKGYIFEYENI